MFYCLCLVWTRLGRCTVTRNARYVCVCRLSFVDPGRRQANADMQGNVKYALFLYSSFKSIDAQYAHGREELNEVTRHPKFKTEVCCTFVTIGTCPYGRRCRFIHRNVPITAVGKQVPPC